MGRQTQRQGIWDNVVFTVLLFVVAGLLAWLSHRYHYQFNWAPEHIRGLSSASQQLLSRFEGPIEVTAYVQPDSNMKASVRHLVERYQAFKPDLELIEVDPLATPEQVRKHGIQVNGELIVHYRERSRHIRPQSRFPGGPLTEYSEQSFSDTLQKLIAQRGLKLRFLSGHGERNLAGRANHDLGNWGELLEQRGYITEPHLPGEEMPAANEETLILAAPQIELLQAELELIQEYLRQGGNLLWLAEPGEQQNLNALAEQIGIHLLPGVILDSSLSDPTLVPLPPTAYQDHPALDGLDLTSLLAEVAAIEIQRRPGWEAHSIILSGENAWLETGPLTGAVQYDPETDRSGPLNLAVALERPRPAPEDAQEADTRTDAGTDTRTGAGPDAELGNQRIVIIGDGDFLSNTYLRNGGNIELGLRLVDWLSANTSLLSIPQVMPKDAKLNLSQQALNLYGVFSIILAPAGLMLTGWQLRRRRQRRL